MTIGQANEAYRLINRRNSVEELIDRLSEMRDEDTAELKALGVEE